MDDKNETISRRGLLATASAAGVAIVGASTKTASAEKPTPGTAIRRLTSRVTPIKQRAMNDYMTSLAPWGGRLSNRGQELRELATRDHFFDVIVIGSGYGGAITAARLAQRIRPGKQIAVLERGREWLPGTFPDSFARGAREFRNGTCPQTLSTQPRSQLGLYDMVYNDDIHVLSGSALGGTSVINANVAILPDAEVFSRDEWPLAIRDLNTLLPWYERAAYELNLQQIDEDTPKARALRYIARKGNIRGDSYYPSQVAVSYRGRGLDARGRNRQGMLQRPCTLCGDCSSGCNVGAKNTLQMNYLPLAKQFGANLYTQTEVELIQKTQDGYRVHFKHFKACGSAEHAFCGSIRARIVIVSAGSLGSTGILLRSHEAGLPISNQLGCRFSGNGDLVGAVVKGDCATNAAGYGAYETTQAPVGVTQQRNLHLNRDAELKYRLLVQEGAGTRAYSSLIGSLLADPNLNRCLFLLAVGHDEAAGRIILDGGQPRVSWPNVENSPYYAYAEAKLRELARLGGGRFRKFDILSGGKPVTVHPLGGCSMSDDPDRGVTDDLGRVFDECGSWSSRPTLHHGLYVADGSLLPTSLGANPYFTIAALSERIADGIVDDRAFADLFQKAA